MSEMTTKKVKKVSFRHHKTTFLRTPENNLQFVEK